MELQEGYYWVKKISEFGDTWTIAEYLGDEHDWMILGVIEGYEEDVTFDVGERLEPPKDI